MNFLAYIEKYLAECKIPLSAGMREKFEELGSNLLQDPFYSSVSKIKDEKDISEKHFLDSLLPLSLGLNLWNEASKILDLGSGGGFPGFPLAIFFPEKKVTALDSKNKSIEFINRIAEKTGITNIRAISGRAEEFGHEKKFREKFDLVVCRAVGDFRIILEYCIPFVRVGGFCLFYKGPKIDEEMCGAKNALEKMKIRAEGISVFSKSPPVIPFSRAWILISKKVETPAVFPRKNGMPASKPL
ncbi:MAG: 16S rRNA (guanine(527)-N(7))-methyltransferase RsmG [Candidatus Riflebacteria bacterium]|nr:16S rRNA (guanine(527)-N(7))-methyltransferase RsmG [Candidatus Riflebacteria bacterium]